jgi:hypothetical protein
MNYYRHYLKIIKNDLGDTTTTNHQLNEYCTSVFGSKYRGCYSIDTIPKLKNGECCIFNLDKSNEKGSHWMGMYKDHKNNIIYDSFGRKSKNLKIPLKNIKDTDYDNEQGLQEKNCGARVCSFLSCCYTIPIKLVMTI